MSGTVLWGWFRDGAGAEKSPEWMNGKESILSCDWVETIYKKVIEEGDGARG